MDEVGAARKILDNYLGSTSPKREEAQNLFNLYENKVRTAVFRFPDNTEIQAKSDALGELKEKIQKLPSQRGS